MKTYHRALCAHCQENGSTERFDFHWLSDDPFAERPGLGRRLRAAKAIGHEVPASMVLRADKAIE